MTKATNASKNMPTLDRTTIRLSPVHKKMAEFLAKKESTKRDKKVSQHSIIRLALEWYFTQYVGKYKVMDYMKKWMAEWRIENDKR